MKFKFKQSAIIEAVQNCCAVIPTKSTMPIIRNLKIECKKDTLVLYATDSEIELCITIKDNIEIIEPGLVLVDGNKFSKILQEIGEGDYEINKENHYLNLTGIGCDFNINTGVADEYPEFSSFEDIPDFVIPGSEVKDMFEKTVFAIRVEPSRYTMHGVLMKGSGSNLDIVATDSRRLALVNVKLESAMKCNDVDCILSSKFVSNIIKIVDNQEVSFKLEGNSIYLKTGDLVISSKLINGAFPDYKRAIPDCNIVIKANRNEINSAIRKATIFTSDITNSIIFSFQNNMLLLHSVMPESGEAHISQELEYEGEPIEMKISPSIFQDGLKVMSKEIIEIHLKDSKRPAVVKGDDNYIYLVMPIIGRNEV